MDLLKVDNSIILRPDNGSISQEFVQNFKSGYVKPSNLNEYIRFEHPNCAFFKSFHKSGDKEIPRTTLYTPEGRLHIDFDINQDEKVQIDKYVKKEEHLNILLFYLRDLEVKPTPKKEDIDTIALIMPKTPLNELSDFVEKDLFNKIISEYEINTKHILSQLRRVYNAKIDILSQKVKGKVKHAVFSDFKESTIDQDLMDKWHFYYIRKARLLK